MPPNHGTLTLAGIAAAAKTTGGVVLRGKAAEVATGGGADASLPASASAGGVVTVPALVVATVPLGRKVLLGAPTMREIVGGNDAIDPTGADAGAGAGAGACGGIWTCAMRVSATALAVTLADAAIHCG